MGTVMKLASSGRDGVARALWLLPHDLRRSAFLRFRPQLASLYREMRTNEIGDIPGLKISLVAADRHRCIFVHVPKNGGTSIGRSLFDPYRGNHLPIATYQMIYDKSDFEAFFKFAFVRNPFDRLLSGYRFMAQQAELTAAAGKSIRTGKDGKPLASSAVTGHEDFEHFVTNWVTPTNVRVFEHFRPQHRFVCTPDGRIPFDHLGRFESMAESFDVITERLGVDVELRHDRPSRDRGDDRHYADHYTPSMRRIAEQVFARDLRLFDYTFDG